MLSEKPVAHDFRDVRRAAGLAAASGLKTKVGFTFRYSPAVRYLQAPDRQRQPRHAVHLQRLRAELPVAATRSTPLRSKERASEGPIQVASLEGYGAPVIDIGHWFMGSDLTAVVGVMRNFIPERMLASTGAMARVNIDDGDIFLGEFASGAICSVQSSFVTVGNYPGIEVRVYGSEGAAIARLVEEFGICETLKVARPDDVEFREVTVPESYYPAGGSPRESWRTLYYANLTANFASEVLGEVSGNEGNFADGLWVQEVINAVEISHHERRWVSLPLEKDGSMTTWERDALGHHRHGEHRARRRSCPRCARPAGSPAAVAGRDLARAEQYARGQRRRARRGRLPERDRRR